MRTVRIAPLLVLLLTAGSARAEIESDAVKRGVAAYDQIDFANAVKVLEGALTESLTREEKIVACRTLAFAQAGLGHLDEARAAFVKLLRVDPNAELDRGVAPRLRALFEEARAQVATGRVAVAPSTLPTLAPAVRPAHPREGQPVSITFVHKGGMAQTLQLYHRVAGDPAYNEVRLQPQGDRFELVLPRSAVRAPGVEYYVTALDDQQAAVARAGTFGTPLRIEVGAIGRPIYKRGWFWGVVAGVVAVGTATGVAVALTRTSANPSGAADVQLIAPR